MRRVREELRKIGVSSKVQVHTVDSFQGSEADIVILSFVRSGGSSVGFLSDFRRLNVALTRAKRVLLAFGNAKTLLTSPVTAPLVQDMQGRDVCFRVKKSMSIFKSSENRDNKNSKRTEGGHQ